MWMNTSMRTMIYIFRQKGAPDGYSTGYSGARRTSESQTRSLSDWARHQRARTWRRIRSTGTPSSSSSSSRGRRTQKRTRVVRT